MARSMLRKTYDQDKLTDNNSNNYLYKLRIPRWKINVYLEQAILSLK